MQRDLIDLLWRDHPAAPQRGARGPKTRVTTGAVVGQAMALADSGGLDAVTLRALGQSLGISTMSIYSHVNSREDLLVLMADAQMGRMPRPEFGRARWPSRVRRLARTNLDGLLAHPWLLDVTDDRLVLGPGTIAKYDYELHAFDGTDLLDVARDKALAFVLDFTRAAARSLVPDPRREAFAGFWERSADRLAAYVGDGYPLARRVGQAAGESMGAAYSPEAAWDFGLERVIDGLAGAIRQADGA